MKLRQTVFERSRALRRLFAKVRNFFGRRRAEDEMVREIAAHLALLEDEFLRQGMDLAEARLAARRAYGGVEQAKELHRDARSLFWLEQMLQDLRHAWRSLSKSPGFVAVALLSLAFGIGVNTAIFTLVNGILLKTLPVPDPHRIVQVSAHLSQAGFDSDGFNFPVFRELRRQRGIFADAIAFSPGTAVLDIDDTPHPIEFELVTGPFFSFFGARPALGRLIDEEDDRLEGAHRVCVLSYQAWQTHFGADPAILRRSILVNRVPLQVIGVAAPDFVGGELQRRFDLWAPTALESPLGHNPRESPNHIWLHVLARLQPGLSLAEAGARLESASRSIEDALPKDRANANAVYRLRDASKGWDNWRTTLHDPLLILMGAVILVLLVACANLANLLLARANERHQEFAIKLSLGISRWRLLRQLLIETFLVAFGGGAAAFLLAIFLSRFLLALFNAGELYATLHVAPDGSILFFTFSVCVLTAVIAGLYPAWQASRTEAGAGLKTRAHGIRRSLVRRSLIVVQVSLAVVLLFGASLFTHSLRNLKTINLGFDIDRILSVEIAGRTTGKPVQPPAMRSELRDTLSRIRRLPTVESAAFSEPGVLSGGMMAGDFKPKGATVATSTNFLFAGSAYFATMHIFLLKGRDFAVTDRSGSPLVAIINQNLASRVWHGENPVGKYFDGWDGKNVEIIGVAGNSKYQGVREESKPIAYLAFDQQQPTEGAIEIRYRGPGGQIENEVRQIVKAAAPDFQVSSATAMELMRDNIISQDRLLTFLSTLFGVLGTVLALVGIYGLISYAVTSRTREIGIRMSVGAQRSDVLWLFLREATLLVFAGLILGLPLALELAVFIRKMLYGVTTSDPLGIWVTLVLIVLGGLLASFVPARRATRVNPVQALRYD